MLIPTAKTIAILANPNSSVVGGETELREIETAARAAALEALLVNASTEHDFEPAFATMAQRGARALILIGDPFFYSHREQTAALAIRYACIGSLVGACTVASPIESRAPIFTSAIAGVASALSMGLASRNFDQTTENRHLQ